MRVASLDIIRGVAVLGILAINIAGFAGPSIGTLTPNLPHPAGPWGEAAYAFGFVVFEGKMRALFAMLFGASMALFLDRAEAAGREADLLQLRRLAWLLLFGALHWALLWWGDILFAYAACGMIVLLMHHLPPRFLIAVATMLFVATHTAGLVANLPMVWAEEAMRLETASPAQTQALLRYDAYVGTTIEREMVQHASGFLTIMATKLKEHPFWLVDGVLDGFGEYVPLMLVGMVLQRSGFFAAAWPMRSMLAVAAVGVFAGIGVTLLALSWFWARHFPVAAMDTGIRYGLALPHLITALGYAALLVLATPRLASTRLGRGLAGAGRMAFSNYIGTSVVMTGIFYGWGLGLFGQVAPLGQWLCVLLGWALMLVSSALWLRHWRRGPLEWLWRSLTERQLQRNRR